MREMLKFNEFLLEQKEGSGLTIFDIDDTLFRTNSRVHVKKDGKIITKLSPAEFNSYKLKSGEEFDYQEFTNAQKFYKEARPITKMLNKLRGILRNIKKKPGSKMILLTARRNFDNKDLFLKTFKKFGIDIDSIRVERAGNIKAKPETAKKMIVNKYLKGDKFKRVRLFDDHPGNLISFLKLQDKYPEVEFSAYLVKGDKVKKYA
tara:strand:- start:28 stop:642 length:615 start_codon:yes stop_codon:yes gene_type:complete